MLTYDEAVAMIEDEGNRHRRKDKATICLGAVGPFTRYIWLEHGYHKNERAVLVYLFGHRIAVITPEGTYADHCGYFTMCNRAAFIALFGRGVWLETPGSKGGTPGEWKVHIGRHVMTENDRSVFIPAG